ncbi:polysaccharide biosynthesis/export family protein [Mucilaginibacter gilvus]|uniref:polysaccharide biosynthesis/export family protein n=1 Tax=Mucilaginibacter gilvus TaxID=2305909 RepID=UPI0014194433|nr:polysaccharide biosynthesis/export family protein [Mucilaginibacter gilvus]
MLFQNKSASNTVNDSLRLQSLTLKNSYRIQPRDQLQIKNLQNIKYIVDELPTSVSGLSSGGTASQGQTFEVDEDGTVALPALGHVPVSGLTRVEATKKIEALYRKELLKDPIIELKITNLKVSLFGEVASPGNFPLLKDNTTLVELIGQAGGLTPNANESNIKIIRTDGQIKTTTEIDLGNINSISDPRTFLQNGDVIYVSQNKRAVRNDKFLTLSTIIQPITLLLSTVLIIFTLKRL